MKDFNMAARNELSMPPGAIMDPNSKEILRAWIVDGGLHVAIDQAFEAPELWGILLVDVARHAARACADQGLCDEREALRKIRGMFDAEWRRPTDRGVTEKLKKL